jgi:hypothetical protein
MLKLANLKLLFLLIFNIFVQWALVCQNTIFFSGRIIDKTTKEGVPFVTIVDNVKKTGTRTDMDGNFKINWNAKSHAVKISSLGYTTLDYTFDTEKDVVIELIPNELVLQDVVIRPDKKRYRNKNNPAVDLIKEVIDHRKNNRVDGFESYQEQQYEKIMMGFTDLPEKIKNRKVLRPLSNIADTSILKGKEVIPAFLQESMQDFYSQRTPKRSKIWVTAQEKVRFPFLDEEGLEKYLRYLYQESDIYDDYVVLMSDHFTSPISDNAPIFYRYYIVDTTQIDDNKIVRLAFFPRNKSDMLLQGTLHIALDSSYPVTRISYSVNPEINLNWVRSLNMDQIFQKLPTGKWVLTEENYALDFGVWRKGMGLFAKRYVSHRDQRMGAIISDTIFQKSFELRSLSPGADLKDSTYWNETRHIGLTETEAAVYIAMDSLQNTPVFKKILKTGFMITTGFYKPVPGIEIGRINTFYSFNPVEGTRLRFGVRSNPLMNKKFHFETYGAYGFKDEKWKFGANVIYTFNKDRAYNRFPYNMLRANYQQDLFTPGVFLIGTFQPTSLATSFVRGTNDRFFFQKKLVIQYEREYQNHFSYTLGVNHRDLLPLGSLTFTPTDDVLKADKSVVTFAPFFQLRYAPGEEFYQVNTGWRRRIRFNTIFQFKYERGVKGIAGSQYNYDDFFGSIYRFTKLPPIGYNYLYLEAGGIVGKVPYPLLTIHRGNQTFSNRFMAYNLMNFMEFVSDRYVSATMEHNFYGFFLNKIPLIRRLNLREIAVCKVLYGQISDKNHPATGSGLYELPKYPDGTPLTYSLSQKPYIEASIGVGNIFKVLRVDLVRRFSYLNHPNTNKFGVRIGANMSF